MPIGRIHLNVLVAAEIPAASVQFKPSNIFQGEDPSHSTNLDDAPVHLPKYPLGVDAVDDALIRDSVARRPLVEDSKYDVRVSGVLCKESRAGEVMEATPDIGATLEVRQGRKFDCGIFCGS